MKVFKWLKKDIEDLKSLYWDSSEDGLLVRFYPRTLGAIKAKAKRLGFKRFRYIKQILFDFDNIDSEIKAYFLGYICADGCVSKTERQSTIRFCCSVKDYDYMKTLRDSISPDSKLFVMSRNSTFGIQQVCGFCISNSRVANQLIDLGIIPNKSLTLKTPELPEVMYKHFWRGYFDGDGSVSISKTKKPPVYCQFVGTYEMMSTLQRIFNKIHSNGSSVIKHSQTRNNTYTLKYGGYAAISFLNWIYNDATIYMERKYIKALPFLRRE